MALMVVIPSAGRADRVKAVRAINADVLCVPESEANAYRRRNYGVDLVTHPDSVRGLPAKRQWIADRFGDVFMVDDDVKAFPHMRFQLGRLVAEDASVAKLARFIDSLPISEWSRAALLPRPLWRT